MAADPGGTRPLCPGSDGQRATFGRQPPTPLPREPIWRKFLEKFDEPIIKVLLAAALLSMAVDLFEQGQKSEGYTPSVVSGVAVGLAIAAVISAYLLNKAEWVPTILFAAAVALGLVGILVVHHPAWDGLAVMVAVVLATGVAFLSEYQSDREFEALNARKDQILVKVVRGAAFP